MGECLKIKDKIEKYLNGKILDFGCGDTKITDCALGADLRDLPTADIKIANHIDVYFINSIKGIAENEPFDVVFSSHFLEHLTSPILAIENFKRILKIYGLLILYLPDADYYDDSSNPEHFQCFKYVTFMRWFEAAFKNTFQVIEHGRDVGEDRYSFYLVAKKVK